MSRNPVAKNHRELIVWQLCHQLRALTLKYTRHSTDDLRWRSQIRASIRSACNNTSEGYYRKRDGDFLNHLIFAVASLGEFEDQLDEGRDTGTFTQNQHEEMRRLLIRAWKANNGLRQHLAASIAKKREQKRAAKAADLRTVRGRSTKPRPDR